MVYRIIDDRCTGKTSRLMLLAKETGAAIACRNPWEMRDKARGYGITGIEFIGYGDLIRNNFESGNVLIDELEAFVRYYVGLNIIGYTLSIDDE